MKPVPLVSSAHARLAALRLAHRGQLPRRQAEIIALQAIGFDVPELVLTLGIERSSVEGSLYAARRDVFSRQSAGGETSPHTRAATNTWVWLHRNCCMSGALSELRREHADAARRLALIDAVEVPLLPAADALLVALIAAGFESSEIARIEAVGLATIKRQEARVRLDILPDGVPSTRSMLAAAVWAHGECCRSLPADFVAAQWRMSMPRHAGPRRHAYALATLASRARTVSVLMALAVSAAFETILGQRRPSSFAERPAVIRDRDR